MLVSTILGAVRFVETSDGDALQQAMHMNPSARLAVVDIKMPSMQGGDRLLELALRHPRIPLVVVSALNSRHLVRRLLSIHSVFAFVPISATTDDVRSAITSAVEGRKVAPPTMLPAGIPRPAMHLTPRQRQICTLLRQGMTNKLIAETLGICEGTVKNHISNIFRVLSATNRTQAAQLDLEVE